MAVAGEQEVEPITPPADDEPPDVGRGGPPGHGRASPDGRRTLVLVAPLVVLVVVVLAGAIGYAAGSGSATDDPSASTPPNTLKPQPVDVGFAADMRDHHEQAVQMALIILEETTNPGIRAHAIAIIAGQRRESGLFEQFLADRGITDVDPRREVMGWMGTPMPWDQMPGMASSQDIVALTNATGEDADRLFLDLMVRHHEAGVHMAEYAVEHAETEGLRDLASRIVLAQKREINDLDQLGLELGP